MRIDRLCRHARFALCGAALSLAGCTAAAVNEAPGARPALWKVADEDTTIYLFGTVHVLPAGLDWRTPALDRAIAASDTLVMEIIQPEDPSALAGLMAKLSVSPGLPPLAERVPEDKRAALQAAVAASGVPMAVLDRLETWAAALAILQASFTKLGLDPAKGAEKTLEASYKEAGKPLDALETAEYQLGLFDALPEESQRLLLLSAIDDHEMAKAQFQEMIDAWSKGDVDAIARTFDDETTLSPDLRAALMTNRNAAWADWLDKRMDAPGTVMVAVGAGHLAGQDSVQKMLEARGIKAQRVQ